MERRLATLISDRTLAVQHEGERDLNGHNY